MELFESLKQKISGQNKTIVFPEGEDVRIIGAASRLAADGLVKPILLGDQDKIKQVAAEHQIDISTLSISNPLTVPEDEKQKLLDALVARRKGKNTPEQAAEMLKDPNYWGTMLVFLDEADGMVSGAIHPTGDTSAQLYRLLRPNLGLNESVAHSSCKKATNGTFLPIVPSILN